MAINELAKKGIDDLWQRSAKVAVPVGGIGGFVSDVLSPLGPFVAILAIAASCLCVLSAIVWFGFKQKEIRKALQDGRIDHDEFQKIRSVNGWSVSFAFSFVAAIVLFTFFGAQKALAVQEPEKGALASVVPGIADFQKRLLGLEEKTARIDETTQRIEVKTDDLTRAIERLDNKVAAIQLPPESAGDRSNTPATPCVDVEGLSRYAKVFLGPDLIVESAGVTEKNADGLNDILVRIRGAEAEGEGIDGQVIRYRTIKGFYGGTDLVYEEEGQIKTRMIFRKDHEGDHVRLFLGGKPFELKIDPKRSKSFCVSDLKSGL